MEKYPRVSPYVYCDNNPVILVDPDGMKPIPGPFTNRVYETSFVMRAIRITTEQRFAGKTGNAIIGFGTGAVFSIYENIRNRDVAGGYSTLGQITSDGFSAFCAAAAAEVPETASTLTSLSKGAGGFSKLIGIIGVYNALRDNAPVPARLYRVVENLPSCP